MTNHNGHKHTSINVFHYKQENESVRTPCERNFQFTLQGRLLFFEKVIRKDFRKKKRRKHRKRGDLGLHAQSYASSVPSSPQGKQQEAKVGDWDWKHMKTFKLFCPKNSRYQEQSKERRGSRWQYQHIRSGQSLKDFELNQKPALINKPYCIVIKFCYLHL